MVEGSSGVRQMGKSVRVYEIAREQSLKSKEVIKRLKEAGVQVKSHSSSVEEDVYERVFDRGEDEGTTDSHRPDDAQDGRVETLSEAGDRKKSSTQREQEPAGEDEASEAAWRKAEELGPDLSKIEDTGSGGRVTNKDVTSAVEEVKSTEKEVDKRAPSRDLLPAAAPSWLSTPHAISGSLPLDFRESEDGGELAPATVFAPPQLRTKESFLRRWTSSEMAMRANGGTAEKAKDEVKATDEARRDAKKVGIDLSEIKGTGKNGRIRVGDVKRAVEETDSSALAATDGSALVSAEDHSPDEEFLGRVEAMLKGEDSDGLQSRFEASSSDVSYDFDEYALLRNPDEPLVPRFTSDLVPPQGIPSDPRFQRFTNAAENAIALFAKFARQEAANVLGTNPPVLGIREAALRQDLLVPWWFGVCAIRAFNDLLRYSRSQIKKDKKMSPEALYGEALQQYFQATATEEAKNFLVTGKDDALDKLLTVEYWEELLTKVFATKSFENIAQVDPTAPEGEYPFDPFSPDEVLFGLRVIHRQTWHLLGNRSGELVKSIPLGPKESQKISTKVVRRTKVARTAEEALALETTAETGTTTKDTSEVVAEASEKLNRHLEAEVNGGIGGFFQAKVSGGISQDISSSSKQTNSNLNETMQKTASRMKRDTKITVSTEGEETFEEMRSSEITNPNDEIAVTYLYHQLQQHYRVSTEIGEVDSVVFVPEVLPEWGDIDEGWVRDHGDVIAEVLLDSSFAPVLASIRQDPKDLAFADSDVFKSAADAGIKGVDAYKGFTGGLMPDILASGPQLFERDYERRNSLAMDMKRRSHQADGLLMHIRRNILHYMRAIWASEDYDQRMQRYSRMRVPTMWFFVPRTPVPAASGPTLPLEVEGVFVPLSESARPLSEVIDPVGPIDYLFNCAIYRLRDDPKLANMHHALAYLRAAYQRFAVDVKPSDNAGVSRRQVVAYAPRSFSADYTFTYRKNSGKWLIENKWRDESEWFEVNVLEDGSLDALGLRIWLDGAPGDKDTLAIELRAMGDLEDPHLRLVQMLHPMPPQNVEARVFTDDLLREMSATMPELPEPDSNQPLTWDKLDDEQKAQYREHYHRFLMLRESGRLVTLDTANVVLDLEVSRSAALEQFKLLHRYLDVRKEYEETRRRALDNTRREKLLEKGLLGDPDIERVSLVGARDDVKDAIALPDGSEE